MSRGYYRTWAEYSSLEHSTLNLSVWNRPVITYAHLGQVDWVA